LKQGALDGDQAATRAGRHTGPIEKEDEIMAIGDFCTRDVVTAISTTDLAGAARLMRDNHVGSLVVVDAAKPLKPIGIITDRDIVTKVVAGEVDAHTVTVGEVVEGRSLACVQEHDSPIAALRLMREHGVRRLPVVKAAGDLCGIVTFDDFVEMESAAIDDLVTAMAGERRRERAHIR
jgi:CBS domain-containing protein